MQTIVVDIADPNEDAPAALNAARSVASPGDRVCLFHNVFHPNISLSAEHPDDAVLGEARDLLLDARELRLRDFAAQLRDLEVSTRATWAKSDWQALIDHAHQSAATLVIAQSDRPGRWRPLHANDDWQLIRHSTTPLLLARPECGHRYRRILAAVDPLHVDDKPAELDQRILRHAARFAEQHQAQLMVLNVLPPTAEAANTASVPLLATEPLHRHMLDAHRQRLATLIEAIDYPVTDATVSCGIPAREIVARASQQQVDLVVMGAVSRSMLRKLLIGSTAEKVLDQLQADTLIVKPRATQARTRSPARDAPATTS